MLIDTGSFKVRRCGLYTSESGLSYSLVMRYGDAFSDEVYYVVSTYAKGLGTKEIGRYNLLSTARAVAKELIN